LLSGYLILGISNISTGLTTPLWKGKGNMEAKLYASQPQHYMEVSSWLSTSAYFILRKWAYCTHWIGDWVGQWINYLVMVVERNQNCQQCTWEEHFSRKTEAEPMAETTARTPLKLFRSCSTIIISMIRDIIATRSSKFSASTIFFSNHRVNCEQILVRLLNYWQVLLYTIWLSLFTLSRYKFNL